MSCAARCGWFVALLMLVGCTKDEHYLEVFRETRDGWGEIADILESIKDEKTLTTGQAAIQERYKKLDATARKGQALPKPPPDNVVRQMNEEKYLMTAIVNRIAKASDRIEKEVPGGLEFIQGFKSKSPGIMSAVQK